MTDQLPGIGALTVDDDGFHTTPPLSVTLLGKDVPFTIFDYDPQQTDKIAQCITNFRTLPAEALSSATNAAFAYYQDFYQAMIDDEDEETLEWLPKIDEPAKVWDHIQLGDTPIVQPGDEDDSPWYVFFECACDWEEEHGLGLVFRNGAEITKVGPSDGDLTWNKEYRDGSGDGLFRVPDYR